MQPIPSVAPPKKRFIYGLWTWFFGGVKVTQEVEQFAGELLTQEGNCYNDDYELDRVSFASETGMAARVKYGFMKDSIANRLVARRFILDAFRERGMRPAHIRRCLPLAIEVAMTPMDSEILAVAIRASNAFRQRREAFNTNYYSRTGWRPWNWFGPQVRPDPVQTT